MASQSKGSRNWLSEEIVRIYQGKNSQATCEKAGKASIKGSRCLMIDMIL